MASLRDKMYEAYDLALDLCFTEATAAGCWGVIDTAAIYGDELSNELWDWAEGRMHQFEERRRTGHCSLQAVLDFDPAMFEAEVDATIVKFKKLRAERKQVSV